MRRHSVFLFWKPASGVRQASPEPTWESVQAAQGLYLSVRQTSGRRRIKTLIKNKNSTQSKGVAGCWPEHAASPKWPQTTLRPGSGNHPAQAWLRARAGPSAEPSSPLIHYFQKVPPCTNYTKWMWPYLVRASRLAFHMPLRKGCCHFRAPGKGPMEVTEAAVSALNFFFFQLLSSLLLYETQSLRLGSDIRTRTWEGEQVFSCKGREILVSLQAGGCSRVSLCRDKRSS